jgi:hypothetical protein
VPPGKQSGLFLLVQIAAAGLLLGMGRQGIDLLLIRSLLIAWAVPVGWMLGSGDTLHCAGLYDCGHGQSAWSLSA